MATRMQHRRGTAADWAALNPILAEGEFGFTTDTKIVKLGDGVSTWNSLEIYLTRKGGVGTELNRPLESNTEQVTNLNQHLRSGWYDTNGGTGAPDGNWWLVEVFAHSNDTKWQRQIAYEMTGNLSAQRILSRRCNGQDPTVSGNWTAWERIDNEGLLVSSRVADTGDTMTGNLIISKDNATLQLEETATDRLHAVADAGLQYIQVDDELRITSIGAGAMKPLSAGNIFDNGQRVYSPNNVPPYPNPFAVIDALGDILVGSGPDAVARLPKGANGTVLTVDGSGNVVWQAPASVDLSTKVSKTGDTMTGDLTLQQAGAAADWSTAALEVQHASKPAIAWHLPGVWAGMISASATGFRNTSDWTSDGALKGAGVYDNGNRVYSATNPPPVSGMSLLGGSSQIANTDLYSGGKHNVGSPFTFVAPATGRVVIETTMYAGHNQIYGVGFSGAGLTGYDNRSYIARDAAGNAGAFGQTFLSGLTPGATYSIQPWVNQNVLNQPLNFQQAVFG